VEKDTPPEAKGGVKAISFERRGLGGLFAVAAHAAVNPDPFPQL
jgi:hypothetical protein